MSASFDAENELDALEEIIPHLDDAANNSIIVIIIVITVINVTIVRMRVCVYVCGVGVRGSNWVRCVR